MNIEELRQKWGTMLPQVGDWVSVGSDFIRLDLGYRLEVVHQTFDPIPLAREILEKVGESQVVGDDCLLSMDRMIFILAKAEKVWLCAWDEFGHPTFIQQIKYVHQLQQLYRFFVEGQEITLEL